MNCPCCYFCNRTPTWWQIVPQPRGDSLQTGMGSPAWPMCRHVACYRPTCREATCIISVANPILQHHQGQSSNIPIDDPKQQERLHSRSVLCKDTMSPSCNVPSSDYNFFTRSQRVQTLHCHGSGPVALYAGHLQTPLLW